MHIIYSCSLIYPYVVKVRPYQHFQKFGKSLATAKVIMSRKSSLGHRDTARLGHVREIPSQVEIEQQERALIDTSMLISLAFEGSMQQHFLLPANQKDL